MCTSGLRVDVVGFVDAVPLSFEVLELSPVAQRYAEAVWLWPAMQSLVAEAAVEPWSLELGL